MCLDNAVTAMRMWKDVAGNFIRQSKRISKKMNVAGGKNSKGSVFGEVAATLMTIGGGNSSSEVTSLTCAKKNTTDGAKQLQNLTSTLTMCQENINTACNTSMPPVDMAFIDQCALTVDQFSAAAELCSDMGADSCDCWTGEELGKLMDEVKLCKISNSSKAVNEAYRVCIDEFSLCRKYEDASVKIILPCSQDPGQLKLQAQNLVNNKNAVSAAAAKISSLTSRGTPLLGNIKRAVSSCADLVTQTTTLVAITDPEDVTITSLATEIADASVTCSTDEITSLKELEDDLETLEAAIDAAVEAIQKLLEEATGSTLPITSTTTRARLRSLKNMKMMQMKK